MAASRGGSTSTRDFPLDRGQRQCYMESASAREEEEQREERSRTQVKRSEDLRGYGGRIGRSLNIYKHFVNDVFRWHRRLLCMDRTVWILRRVPCSRRTLLLAAKS